MLLDGVCSQVQPQRVQRRSLGGKIKLAVPTAARESIIQHIGPHREDVDKQETETSRPQSLGWSFHGKGGQGCQQFRMNAST